MEILEDAQETMFFPSCGAQAESMKRTNPIWSMTKAGRDAEKKVFLAKNMQQDSLGKDSPGHVYSPLRQKEAPKFGFGTAPARPSFKQKYPETSNDLLGRNPQHLTFKYKCSSNKISTCPRDARSNAPDLKAFDAGTLSPGPQRYNPQNCPPQRLAHAPSLDQVAPKYTMRLKTEAKDLLQSTGAKVGPGKYPHPDACNVQASSEKPSLPQWKINHRDRFPEKKKNMTVIICGMPRASRRKPSTVHFQTRRRSALAPPRGRMRRGWPQH